MAGSILREKLARREFFVAPGVHDALAARIANKVGFDVVYGSGYWTTASRHGLPDAGIATYTQMLSQMQMLAGIADAALIADGDTGYGGLLNVHHTVRGYEAAGITAIQLEDQEFPKKCGHTPHRRCIPLQDMADKVRVACEARRDSENFLVIARTDAADGEGLDSALRRIEAYDKAGADILFVEGLRDETDMRRVTGSFGKPVLLNMSDSGTMPALSADQIRELGFAFAIYPSMSGLAALAAIERAMTGLKETGISGAPAAGLFSFKEFTGMNGFEDVWAFERRWARGENEPTS